MNLWNARFRAAIITLATLTMTAATLAGVIVRPALADGTTYSAAKRQFKVGILLLDSTVVAAQRARGPENPDPYVFYIADQRADVKPAGWEFVNPLAPGTITPDVRARWTARDPSHLYRVGQKVTKDMAAYWEVSLHQASIQQLLQYDLLFITNHRLTAFSPAEREKLRKVVDAGGIVWIENCGGMTVSRQSPFFLEQVSFVDGGAVGTPVINKPDHPLLNTPYRLTFDEVNNLGDKQYTSYMVSLDDPKQAPNPEVLVNIVGDSAAKDANGNGFPYIAAGNYGGGTVIATASDCGCDINDYIGGVNAGSGGNSGAYSGSNFTAAHTEDLKFLYNMVSWGSASGDFRRNTRRIAASFESVGAPLVPTFSFTNDLTQASQGVLNDIADSRTSGVIANGAYFFTGTQNGKITVRAYDLNPLRDLDGDGNIDDGLTDLSLGLPYDEIWRWTGPDASNTEQASPPVFASVSTGNGGRSEYIYVTLPDGTLLILTAFPRQGGSFLPAPGVLTVPGTGGAYNTTSVRPMPRGVAPAPVFFENRIYQIEPNGLVRCISAADGTVLWTSFKTAPTSFTYRATGTPAVGFVRQSSEVSVLSRNSGGTTNDLMMYIPASVQEGGTMRRRARRCWLTGSERATKSCASAMTRRRRMA